MGMCMPMRMTWMASIHLGLLHLHLHRRLHAHVRLLSIRSRQRQRPLIGKAHHLLLWLLDVRWFLRRRMQDAGLWLRSRCS